MGIDNFVHIPLHTSFLTLSPICLRLAVMPSRLVLYNGPLGVKAWHSRQDKIVEKKKKVTKLRASFPSPRLSSGYFVFERHFESVQILLPPCCV